MSECINLKTLQSKYRVFTAESYFAETGSSTNSNTDSWNWELKGSRGTIIPWGGEMLGLCIDGHAGICKRLTREPWVDMERSQYGDDGINAIFHSSNLMLAAKYAKLYVVPVLSLEERQRRVEAGRRLGMTT